MLRGCLESSLLFRKEFLEMKQLQGDKVFKNKNAFRKKQVETEWTGGTSRCIKAAIVLSRGVAADQAAACSSFGSRNT